MTMCVCRVSYMICSGIFPWDAGVTCPDIGAWLYIYKYRHAGTDIISFYVTTGRLRRSCGSVAHQQQRHVVRSDNLWCADPSPRNAAK